MNTKIKLSNKLEVFPAAPLGEEEEKKKNGMLLEKLSRVRTFFLSQSHGFFSLYLTLFCFSFLSLTVARVAVILNRKLNGSLVEVSILRIHKPQVVIMRN
jgi:hypothetical protein